MIRSFPNLRHLNLFSYPAIFHCYSLAKTNSRMRNTWNTCFATITLYSKPVITLWNWLIKTLCRFRIVIYSHFLIKRVDFLGQSNKWTSRGFCAKAFSSLVSVSWFARLIYTCQAVRFYPVSDWNMDDRYRTGSSNSVASSRLKVTK